MKRRIIISANWLAEAVTKHGFTLEPNDCAVLFLSKADISDDRGIRCLPFIDTISTLVANHPKQFVLLPNQVKPSEQSIWEMTGTDAEAAGLLEAFAYNIAKSIFQNGATDTFTGEMYKLIESAMFVQPYEPGDVYFESILAQSLDGCFNRWAEFLPRPTHLHQMIDQRVALSTFDQAWQAALSPRR